MAQDLESAVAAQTAGMQADQVMDLVLDTCKATKVTGLEKFSNLRTLTLNGCGLTTLEGFPTLPALRKLELRDNNLSDGLDALQDAALFQLKSLSLAGNKFATLEDLEPLSSLPNLKDLDLFNCPITEVDNYRSGLFDMLPNLKYLDEFDSEDNEKDEDDDDDSEGDEDDDDQIEDDDDLLDSEGGDLGEEGDESEFGEEGDSELGEEGDSELGEDEGDFGEAGEEDGEEGDDDEEGDDEDAHDSKRRKT